MRVGNVALLMVSHHVCETNPVCCL